VEAHRRHRDPGQKRSTPVSRAATTQPHNCEGTLLFPAVSTGDEASVVSLIAAAGSTPSCQGRSAWAISTGGANRPHPHSKGPTPIATVNTGWWTPFVSLIAVTGSKHPCQGRGTWPISTGDALQLYGQGQALVPAVHAGVCTPFVSLIAAAGSAPSCQGQGTSPIARALALPDSSAATENVDRPRLPHAHHRDVEGGPNNAASAEEGLQVCLDRSAPLQVCSARGGGLG